MLAHELSHVAHRDVLVMTVAASAGHRRGHGHPGRPVRRPRPGALAAATTAAARSASSSCWSISLVVYAISFVLLRLLSRYRELCADRSGAYLTQKPSALASALTKISGQMNAVPERDLRAAQSMNAFFITPADPRAGPGHAHLDAPAARAAARPARQDRRQPRPDRCDAADGSLGRAARAVATARGQPRRPVRAAVRGPDPGGRRWACTPPAVGVGLLPRRRGPGRRPRRSTRRPTWSPSTVDRPPRAAWTSTATPGSPSAPTRRTSRALVTDLHAVNSALEVQGFGTGLLCSTVGFRDDDGRRGVPRLPLQAGHLLPVLPDRPDAAATR